MVQSQKRPAPDLDDTERTQKSASRSSRAGARSCEGCHQRKVRCDRGVPCINCSRYDMTCVYPTRDPDPERKTPSLRDIANRLKGIELLLSRLGERIEASAGSTVVGGAVARQNLDQPSLPLKTQSSASFNAFGTTHPHPSDRSTNKSTWEILLNNSDVDPLQDESSSGSETAPSHPRGYTTPHHKAATHSKSVEPPESSLDVMAFCPDTQLALRLWDVYVKSVDPVIKILHIPTVQSTVVATILDPRSAKPSTAALTFAIYYAAVTALCHDGNDEPIDLPCEKSLLVKRYQSALDRLLVTPELMSQPDIPSLQALAIYVTCLRAHELGRRVWVLTGLVIRLAQSISLHRDGSSLKLSPFETEMRIRLWWHLCVLDSRAPEDQGFQPTIDLANQELRLPLNVNDDQIYSGMTHFPTASNGWTEMTFFLIQTESCRIIYPVLDTQPQHSGDTLASLREKRKLIQDPAQYLIDKFGISPLSGVPTDLSRIAIQHVITGCRKMDFVLQLREEICMRKQNEVPSDMTPEVLKPSFKLACDTLEASHLLLKDCSASKYKWFFNIYTQWYALAYVLRALRSSPCGFEADRAWALIDGLFPDETSHQDHSVEIHDEHGHGRIWKFLKLLRHRAWSLKQDAQPSSTSANDRAQLPQLPSTAAPQPTRFPENSGSYMAPEWIDEFFTGPDQIASPSLNLLMPEIPFLPDWNAIINGQ